MITWVQLYILLIIYFENPLDSQDLSLISRLGWQFSSKKIVSRLWAQRTLSLRVFKVWGTALEFWEHIPKAFSFGCLWSDIGCLWSDILVYRMYQFIIAPLANYPFYLLMILWVSLWDGLRCVVLLMLSSGDTVVSRIMSLLQRCLCPNPWC